MALNKNLTIEQGKTFTQVIRWATDGDAYRAISGVSSTAPVTVTATAHGIPSGWPVSVQSVKGMASMNTLVDMPATVVDVNSVTFDADASLYGTYKGGGYLKFKTPHDLSGYTGRMSIKDKVGGTELLSLTTTNGRIVVDNTAKTITLTADAVTTAALTFKAGVYDLELVAPDTTVTLLLYGKVALNPEITT